jgi:hypothetical protein
MALTRRIFVSSPRDEYLDENRNGLKWAIVDQIETLGYQAQVFGSPDGGRGLASGKAWSPRDAEAVMQRCIGAAVLGFPIWKSARLVGGNTTSLVTEYCHYEGAVARAYGLPILAVLEEGVEERVFFNRYGGDAVIRPPAQAGASWVTDATFRRFLEGWKSRISERRDVFLAYSGALEGTAVKLKAMLTALDVTVLDWKRDFVGGRTILEQVEDAAKRTSGGVFLFTRDDVLGNGEQAAPRDNVIFEAGFFAAAKGHDRVLIIREAGAKMPADLGGVVYENLVGRSKTSGLKERLQRFIEGAL